MSDAGCCDVIANVAPLDEHFGFLAQRYRSLMEGRGRGRMTELCAIAACCATGELDELEAHLRTGISIDVAPAQMLEAILINANYSGLLKVARAVERFVGVVPEPIQGQVKQDYPTDSSDDGFNLAGLQAGTELYGPSRARANFHFFRAWDPAIAEIVESVIYGGIDRRRVLSHVDRELCSVAVLTALGQDFSLEWHARVALELGASPGEVRSAAIGELPHVGFPLVVTALLLIDKVVDAWSNHVQATMAWE